MSADQAGRSWATQRRQHLHPPLRRQRLSQPCADNGSASRRDTATPCATQLTDHQYISTSAPHKKATCKEAKYLIMKNLHCTDIIMKKFIDGEVHHTYQRTETGFNILYEVQDYTRPHVPKSECNGKKSVDRSHNIQIFCCNQI